MAQPPKYPPNGAVDAVQLGTRKLTVQTEFFHEPHWRGETKIYIGGALKQVLQNDLSQLPEESLHIEMIKFHKEQLQKLAEKLKNR